MSDQIQPTEQQAIVKAEQAAADPYRPPASPMNVPPRPQPRPVAPQGYRPWTRALTYVVFGLGMAAAGFLWFAILPHAIVMGWFALGCGIPAVLLANKEIGRFPEAAEQGFIKWGKRTGLLGVIIGPASAIIWIIIVAAIGFSF
jgi:hypothetical protein